MRATFTAHGFQRDLTDCILIDREPLGWLGCGNYPKIQSQPLLLWFRVWRHKLHDLRTLLSVSELSLGQAYCPPLPYLLL